MQTQVKDGKETADISTENKETIQKTRGQKWLGRLGTFMIYGGWMVILIVGFVLYIVIQLNCVQR